MALLHAGTSKGTQELKKKLQLQVFRQNFNLTGSFLEPHSEVIVHFNFEWNDCIRAV